MMRMCALASRWLQDGQKASRWQDGFTMAQDGFKTANRRVKRLKRICGEGNGGDAIGRAVAACYRHDCFEERANRRKRIFGDSPPQDRQDGTVLARGRWLA
eukprot:409335-Pyramimonas_sp.AAC.1